MNNKIQGHKHVGINYGYINPRLHKFCFYNLFCDIYENFSREKSDLLYKTALKFYAKSLLSRIRKSIIPL